MPGEENRSLKKPDMYEDLRDEGASKDTAARISNAAANEGESSVGHRGGEAENYEDRTVDELKDRVKELGLEGLLRQEQGRAHRPAPEPLTDMSGPLASVHDQVVTFGTLRIGFDDRVLRPREWTAAQSAWAAELLDVVPPGPVLELCAGVGHIGLMATADPMCGAARRLVLVDVNPVACAWARVNAHTAGRADVDVREAELAEACDAGEMFPLVIADPPWVTTAEIGSFPDDPRVAIDGGEDGLGVARLCLEVIERHLAPGGAAVLQLGSVGQVDALAAWLASAGSALELGETRVFERGLLVLVGRTPC